MSRPYALFGTFTARTGSGTMEVPISRLVALLGIEGFAVHREIREGSFVAESFVVSHVATGMKMPGRPGYTTAQAVARCLTAMASKGITRETLESKILILQQEEVLV